MKVDRYHQLCVSTSKAFAFYHLQPSYTATIVLNTQVQFIFSPSFRFSTIWNTQTSIATNFNLLFNEVLF